MERPQHRFNPEKDAFDIFIKWEHKDKYFVLFYCTIVINNTKSYYFSQLYSSESGVPTITRFLDDSRYHTHKYLPGVFQEPDPYEYTPRVRIETTKRHSCE